ncbi:MAG TPA: dihydroorotate dehydrogenase electron transfer subunit [Candidatus Enterenecus stercoripullorum]|nr:dihydroorotate dehydrogenase electron transfer subunit [Candidatus Enterenecus stercoripullorum]
MRVETQCKILELTQLSSGGWSMTLESKGIAAQISAPGQFLHIKCGDSQLLRRPISICNWSAQRDLIRIVFEARGEGTRWLSQRQVGDSLDVLGPLGNGFSMKPDGKYLLVGGGIGVPPMLGCAVHGGSVCAAVLGFRSAQNTMLLEEFGQACPGGVRLATDNGSLGHHGFVDALVRQELSEHAGCDGVLACGPKPMLKSVAAVCAEKGVPCQVSMEERMGCGVGACLVCACKNTQGHYMHVCKDGPVFSAQEVDWND